MVQRRSIVLLSGGIDSASLIPFLVDEQHHMIGLFVDYGQASAQKELAAARDIAEHFGIPLMTRLVNGASRKTAGVIPGRNAFLLTLAFAELQTPAGQIAIGIHAGTQYADCAPAFVDQMQNLADVYFRGTVRILAPFLQWSKRDIWCYAGERLPVHKTYSCELGLSQPCGKCLSCQDLESLYACP